MGLQGYIPYTRGIHTMYAHDCVCAPEHVFPPEDEGRQNRLAKQSPADLLSPEDASCHVAVDTLRGPWAAWSAELKFKISGSRVFSDMGC